MVDLENEDPLNFNYKIPSDKLSRQGMLSVALHDITIKHTIPHEAAKDTAEQFAPILPGVDKLLSFCTVRNCMEGLTGIRKVLYDCPSNHMVYTMCPNLESCIYCSHPWWKSQSATATANDPYKRIPYVTHSYVPVAHYIHPMYTNDYKAATFPSYRLAVEKDCRKDLWSDYWSSNLFIEMRRKGLFDLYTNVSFMFSFDGIKVFKVDETLAFGQFSWYLSISSHLIIVAAWSYSTVIAMLIYDISVDMNYVIGV